MVSHSFATGSYLRLPVTVTRKHKSNPMEKTASTAKISMWLYSNKNTMAKMERSRMITSNRY